MPTNVRERRDRLTLDSQFILSRCAVGHGVDISVGRRFLGVGMGGRQVSDA